MKRHIVPVPTLALTAYSIACRIGSCASLKSEKDSAFAEADGESQPFCVPEAGCVCREMTFDAEVCHTDVVHFTNSTSRLYTMDLVRPHIARWFGLNAWRMNKLDLYCSSAALDWTAQWPRADAPIRCLSWYV